MLPTICGILASTKLANRSARFKTFHCSLTQYFFPLLSPELLDLRGLVQEELPINASFCCFKNKKLTLNCHLDIRLYSVEVVYYIAFRFFLLFHLAVGK